MKNVRGDLGVHAQFRYNVVNNRIKKTITTRREVGTTSLE